jgi:hypothetical protein
VERFKLSYATALVDGTLEMCINEWLSNENMSTSYYDNMTDHRKVNALILLAVVVGLIVLCIG